jgi:hypothetical protein
MGRGDACSDGTSSETAGMQRCRRARLGTYLGALEIATDAEQLESNSGHDLGVQIIHIGVQDVAGELLLRVDLWGEEEVASLLLLIFFQRNVNWVGLDWRCWARVGLHLVDCTAR